MARGSILSEPRRTAPGKPSRECRVTGRTPCSLRSDTYCANFPSASDDAPRSKPPPTAEKPGRHRIPPEALCSRTPRAQRLPQPREGLFLLAWLMRWCSSTHVRRRRVGVGFARGTVFKSTSSPPSSIVTRLHRTGTLDESCLITMVASSLKGFSPAAMEVTSSTGRQARTQFASSSRSRRRTV